MKQASKEESHTDRKRTQKETEQARRKQAEKDIDKQSSNQKTEIYTEKEGDKARRTGTGKTEKQKKQTKSEHTIAA